jgi:hypothetical protein
VVYLGIFIVEANGGDCWKVFSIDRTRRDAG